MNEFLVKVHVEGVWHCVDCGERDNAAVASAEEVETGIDCWMCDGCMIWKEGREIDLSEVNAAWDCEPVSVHSLGVGDVVSAELNKGPFQYKMLPQVVTGIDTSGLGFSVQFGKYMIQSGYDHPDPWWMLWRHDTVADSTDG